MPYSEGIDHKEEEKVVDLGAATGLEKSQIDEIAKKYAGSENLDKDKDGQDLFQGEVEKSNFDAFIAPFKTLADDPSFGTAFVNEILHNAAVKYEHVQQIVAEIAQANTYKEKQKQELRHINATERKDLAMRIDTKGGEVSDKEVSKFFDEQSTETRNLGEVMMAGAEKTKNTTEATDGEKQEKKKQTNTRENEAIAMNIRQGKIEKTLYTLLPTGIDAQITNNLAANILLSHQQVVNEVVTERKTQAEAESEDEDGIKAYTKAEVRTFQNLDPINGSYKKNEKIAEHIALHKEFTQALKSYADDHPSDVNERFDSSGLLMDGDDFLAFIKEYKTQKMQTKDTKNIKDTNEPTPEKDENIQEEEKNIEEKEEPTPEILSMKQFLGKKLDTHFDTVATVSLDEEGKEIKELDATKLEAAKQHLIEDIGELDAEGIAIMQGAADVVEGARTLSMGERMEQLFAFIAKIIDYIKNISMKVNPDSDFSKEARKKQATLSKQEVAAVDDMLKFDSIESMMEDAGNNKIEGALKETFGGAGYEKKFGKKGAKYALTKKILGQLYDSKSDVSDHMEKYFDTEGNILPNAPWKPLEKKYEKACKISCGATEKQRTTITPDQKRQVVFTAMLKNEYAGKIYFDSIAPQKVTVKPTNNPEANNKKQEELQKVEQKIAAKEKELQEKSQEITQAKESDSNADTTELAKVKAAIVTELEVLKDKKKTLESVT